MNNIISDKDKTPPSKPRKPRTPAKPKVEGALKPGQKDTLTEPVEHDTIKIPEITTPDELASFARKTLLPVAIQTYVNIVRCSKDEKMQKAAADAMVELASVKQKEASGGPAFVLNLGQDFLQNLKGGMQRVVDGTTAPVKRNEITDA